MAIFNIDPSRAARLLNVGPVVIISARYQGIVNCMPLAWICPMSYQPATLSVVMNRESYTRSLVEKSGYMMVQVPTVSQIDMLMTLGTQSYLNNPNKLKESGVEFFTVDEAAGYPMVEGAVAWLLCRIIPDAYLDAKTDMLIIEVEKAWVDERVYTDGVWDLEKAPESLHPVHYVNAGQFYTMGKGVRTSSTPTVVPTAHFIKE